MPLSCGWNDMNASSTSYEESSTSYEESATSYEESAGPGSAVTGAYKRLCGTTGTTGTTVRRQ
jgi:hypothetical protein